MNARLIISTSCLIAAAVMAVAILVFTHLPNDRVPHLVVRIGDDKLRHVLSYGLFSALLFGGLRPWLPNPVKALAWVAVIGTSFAMVDELTQPLTGRTCSLLNFIASFGGTLLGGSVMLITAILAGQELKPAAAPVAADTGKPTAAPHPWTSPPHPGPLPRWGRGRPQDG